MSKLIGGKRPFIVINGRLMKRSSDNKLQPVSNTDNSNETSHVNSSKPIIKDTKANTVNHVVSTQTASIVNITSPSSKTMRTGASRLFPSCNVKQR